MPKEPPAIHWSESALFLDVDGTLLEIEEVPEAVHADGALIGILEDARRELGGALALVSGRPVADVDRIFSASRFVIVGAHGAEIRWADGRSTSEAANSLPRRLTERARHFSGEHDGLLLEEKKHGIALHYRQAPDLGECCRQFMQELAHETDDAYRLLEGKMVIEMTPRRYDKGTGIARVLEAAPFHGRTPVYVGDDVTDEDGFRVVNERAGVSIRVGHASRTEARFTLDSVAAVRAWLRGLAAEGAVDDSHKGEAR